MCGYELRTTQKPHEGSLLSGPKFYFILKWPRSHRKWKEPFETKQSRCCSVRMWGQRLHRSEKQMLIIEFNNIGSVRPLLMRETQWKLEHAASHSPNILFPPMFYRNYDESSSHVSVTAMTMDVRAVLEFAAVTRGLSLILQVSFNQTWMLWHRKYANLLYITWFCY